MDTAEDVVNIYNRLSTADIQIWLTGGWGIDALLGEQTRPHKDLDVVMLLEDVQRTRQLLASDGYRLKEIWSENRWVVDDDGIRIATAFVLHDLSGREFDAHVMRIDDQGNGIPTWEAGDFIFKKQELAGLGVIAGFAVQCITPESQMVCHAGYELPEKQLCDLELLHEKFGVGYPEAYYSPQVNKGLRS